MSQGFYAVCWDDLDAFLGVLEGGILAMKVVRLIGGHTVGGTVGGTVGLAMAQAVVV